VFQIKRNQDGKVERYKISIAAQGFIQKEEVGYEETFSPVANLDSIWTIVSLAAKYDLQLDQMGVSTAYLNGKLEEKLYPKPPEGVPVQPRYSLDKKLKELGFTQFECREMSLCPLK
jgi:hypothetical protein